MIIDIKTLTLIHTALFMSLLPVPGLGQTPSTGDRPILEELIVTAQKREQNLQDVPVGVSLLSGRAMMEAQLKNAEELATLLPTLNVQASSGPSTSSFNIRGIGTQAFSTGVDPSVSTMLDGVVMGRSGMAFLDLVDVQRVEVLRGPQGTLYGKNASGGVVHIITKDPTPELSGTAAATAIENDEYRLDGSISGPITDTLGYRLTASGVDNDGYAENFYTGDKLNSSKSYNVRGKLLWQANEDLEFLLASDYSWSDCKCTSLSVRSVGESLNQQASLDALLPVVPSDDNQNVNNDERTFTHIRSSGVSLTTNWEINDFTLTSITAYRNWESESWVDLDNLPGNPLQLSATKPPLTEQDQFSQEFRLTSPPADWGSYVVGAFYFEQHIDSSSVLQTDLAFPDHPEPTIRTGSTKVSGENSALFGEVNFNLRRDWVLILGGRFTYDDLNYRTNAELSGANVFGIFAKGGSASESLNESDFSPKIALQWDVTDTAMAYASYVSGYKGPAFDTTLIAAGTQVKPETSDAFETGLKSRWFDDRLFINASVYYAEYHDYQAQSFVEDPNVVGLGNFIVVNAGEVSTQGVEIEFMAAPMDDWTMTGGFAYTDATIDDFPKGNCGGGQKARGECPDGFQDLSGGTLPYTPEWKVNLSTDYTIRLQDLPFDVVLGTNIRWQDAVLYELSQDKNATQDAFTIVDIRATLLGKSDGYRVTAFVKNLFDESYASLIFGHSEVLLPNGYLQLVPKYANRTAGIEVRYDF
jgi:iron complex outermembrane receptor protein|tara:strand:+ start:40061 stop:42328 length:2268 start_codon:yes stop_codon:yes gene_type:complete